MVIISVASYLCSLIAVVVDMDLVAIVFDGQFPFLYSALICSSYKTQRENNNEFICFYHRRTLSLSW